MLIGRRSFFGGVTGALAMPAIVRVESVMRVVRPKLILPRNRALLIHSAGGHGFPMGRIITDAEDCARLLRHSPHSVLELTIT